MVPIILYVEDINYTRSSNEINGNLYFEFIGWPFIYVIDLGTQERRNSLAGGFSIGSLIHSTGETVLRILATGWSLGLYCKVNYYSFACVLYTVLLKSLDPTRKVVYAGSLVMTHIGNIKPLWPRYIIWIYAKQDQYL